LKQRTPGLKTDKDKPSWLDDPSFKDLALISARQKKDRDNSIKPTGQYEHGIRPAT